MFGRVAYRSIAVIPLIGVADTFLAGLAVVHGKSVHIHVYMAHLQRRDRCSTGLQRLKAGVIHQSQPGPGSAASKSLLAQRNQPEIGPDQFNDRNTVALDYGESGFGERPMPVQTVAHRGQAAVGCIDFGSGLLENESAREPKALTGCAMLLYRPRACYCRLWGASCLGARIQ